MNRSTIAPGPTTIATACPPWCDHKHPLHVETDTRIHTGTITTRGIAIAVEQLEDGHRLHVDERDVEDGLTLSDALALSYALEVAEGTIRRAQR